MKFVERVSSWMTPPPLTTGRIWFAFTVAAVTDAVQVALGPLGWAFADEILDVVAMILTCRALGFHVLLLPTFVIELIPVADMLPTWTGCTAAVVMMRKAAARVRSSGTAEKPPIIAEVTSERVDVPRPQLGEGKD